MAQQQQQQQQSVRPPGQPQRPTGIPSYLTPVEGLSISQALVYDVLADLQTKALNETVQQYQDDSGAGTYFGKIYFLSLDINTNDNA